MASLTTWAAPAQVLGKVTIAFGVFAFFGVLVILAVLLGRDEPVGYAFVVSRGRSWGMAW